MKTCILLVGALWLACACFVAADPALKDNAREYLALRSTLQATALTPAQVDGPRSPWRGKVVELYGRVACMTAGAPSTITLQVPGAQHFMPVDLDQAHPLAEVDSIVHVLADLAADAKPSDHFRLKAIILEADLPAAEQRYAASVGGNDVKVAEQVAAQVATGTAPKNEKASTGRSAPETPRQAPPQQEPPRQVARPGTDMPEIQLKGVTAITIGVWKQWVGKINSKLTAEQLELIVRSVLYYSALYGVDHRLSFAMIKCESSFNPTCVSHAGATGLCQLMPGTAAGLGVDRWDIEQNIHGGIKYLSGQLHAYSGRSNYEQFAMGLASYNAGPNAVKRAGGVPNIPETIRYVKKVGDLFVQLCKTMP